MNNMNSSRRVGRTLKSSLAIGIALALGIAAFLYRRHQIDSATPVGAQPATASTPGPEQVASVAAFNSPQPSNDERESLDPAYEEWLQGVVTELASRNDANSLLAAALLLPVMRGADDHDSFRQRMLKFLQRAAKLAPDDAIIQALALMTCETLPDCDSSSYEKALRSIDPKNALGWYAELRRAIDGNDPEALTKALSAMAAADRFDLYGTSSVQRVLEAIDSVRIAPPPSLKSASLPTLRDAAAISAYGVIAAIPIPPFGWLAKNCKADVGSIIEQCAGIGAALERSDSLGAQGIGLAIEMNEAKPGSDAAARIAGAQRQFQWLMYSLSQTFQSTPTEWLRILGRSRTEADAVREWLRETGRPLSPPEDWKAEMRKR